MPKPNVDNLFDNCVVALVESRHLKETLVTQLRATIEKRGGEVIEPLANGDVDLDSATHIIANSIDFPQYDEAMEKMVPVVTDQWITNSLYKGKISQVRPFSPDPRMIFSNVHLTCGDIPQSDAETIIGATMAFGGMESKDLSKLTTHICALSTDHPKCQEALKRKFPCKIVLPHWFDDCFKLGKRISEEPYLLPNPAILDSPSKEPTVTVPPTPSLVGATSDVPTDMEAAGHRSTRDKCTVFSGKKIMLSKDLQLSARFYEIVDKIITDGGGEIVDDIDACHMFICKYRDGPQYVHASQYRKDVGNLSWLFYLISHNEWCSPLRRLLHYPIPRHGIEGFQDMKITVSNYGGEARIYLENLIKATGATFTKTMKAENTHLITARKGGEKSQAALEWNINMLNHLWLEESYARCELLALTSPRFTTFPDKTNLGEIIGQTFFDPDTLRNLYYPGGPEIGSPAPKRKRKSAARSMELQDPEQLEVLRDEDVATTNTARMFATPARPRRMPLGKENDASSVISSGSRSAKDKALSRLHGMAPDIALYEKEKKRKTDGGTPWGGKRAADQIDRARAAGNNSSSPVPARAQDEEEEDIDEDAEEAKRPAKKAKKGLPPVEMRIILTGYQRWLGPRSTAEDFERKKLRSHGITIVQENQPCDYLAAPCIVRTKKFLQVLARGPKVIDTAFIDAVLEQGKMLPVEDYLLKDRDNEDKFRVNLQEAVVRARENRGRLLANTPIYCTDGIPNHDSFKDIALANGATFMLYKARSGVTIKETTREEDGGRDPEPVYLISGTSTKEKLLWPKFTTMAEKGNMEPRIVTSDWLLDVAMRQEVEFNDDYLAANQRD